MTEQSIAYPQIPIELIPFAHNFIRENPVQSRDRLKNYYKERSRELRSAIEFLEYDTARLNRFIFDSFYDESAIRPKSFWELCKDGVYYPAFINEYRGEFLSLIGGDNSNLRTANDMYLDFVNNTQACVIYSIAKPEQVLPIADFMGGIPADLFESRSSQETNK